MPLIRAGGVGGAEEAGEAEGVGGAEGAEEAEEAEVPILNSTFPIRPSPFDLLNS
ncbi:MAG: hypothetical protein F6K21_17015 [Symploca sp. SIO2D2]|nr:hypothetical protein [Symploca sp. SIO2D2]